jgi:hypothetical protein
LSQVRVQPRGNAASDGYFHSHQVKKQLPEKVTD